MNLLNITLFYLGLSYVTWTCFLAVMSLLAAKREGKLSKTTLYLGYPLAGVGVLLDFTLNMMASLVFLDIPREWLLTIRCDKALGQVDPKGVALYRQKIAKWICSNLLDPFQSGGHCHPKT